MQSGGMANTRIAKYEKKARESSMREALLGIVEIYRAAAPLDAAHHPEIEYHMRNLLQ